MLGLVGTDTVSRIPRPLHRAVLRVLRPAESAVRRLIVIAARGLVVKLAPSRPMPKGHIIGKGSGTTPPSFQLFDPRKHFPELRQRRESTPSDLPRASISSTPIPGGDPVASAPARAPLPPPPPDGLVNAAAPHPQAPGPQARA